MNANIQEAFLKIFESEELLDKFMKMDDVDQMYQFCLSLKGGYTKAEFEDFMMQYADMCLAYSKLGIVDTLSDDDIALVSGGAGAVKKWVSGSLAALTVLSGVPSGVRAEDVGTTAAAAADSEYVNFNPAGTDGVPGENADDDEPLPDETSFKDKVKKKFETALGVIKRNKGKIALGTLVIVAIAAVVTGLTILYFKKGKEIDPNNPRKTIEDNLKAAKEAYENLAAGNNPTANALNEAKANLDAMKTAYDTFNKGFFSRTFNSIKENSKVAAGILSGIGLVGLAGKAVWSLVKGGMRLIVNAADNLKKISDSILTAEKLAEGVKRKVQQWMSVAITDEFNKEERRAQLLKDLERVKGQEKAKEQVLKIFDEIAQKREDYKRGFLKKENMAPSIVVFNGSAGVGKTMCAKLLAKALNVSVGNEYKQISATAQILGKNPTQMKQNMFGVYAIGNGDVSNNIGEFAIVNPQGVAVIDEYDKLSAYQGKHPLDEIFREIYDNHFIQNPWRLTENIDFSQFTFILTTNESNDSLMIKEMGSTDPDDPDGIMDDNTDKVVDPTITHVNHDKSFLTRIRVIPFERLKVEQIAEVAESQFGDLMTAWTEYYDGCSFRYKKDFYQKIARWAIKQEAGAREIEKTLYPSFSSAVGSVQNERITFVQKKLAKELKTSMSNIHLKEMKDFKFDLDFDEKNAKFIVTPVSYGNYSDGDFKALIEKE